MPPLVSTSTTRKLRASPHAWPLSHGVCGHGTRSMVVRTAVMVMSLMGAFPSLLRRMLRKSPRGVNRVDYGSSCAARTQRFYCTGRLVTTGGAHAEAPNHFAKTPPAERSFFPRHHGRGARPPRLHLRHDRALCRW